MAFVTGLLLIDAPASALNNLGSIPGERVENTSGVKVIRTREGMFPYVSAQAFRYWVRTTAQERIEGWKAAPIYREEKIAYTDSNPIVWWDDDLLGYMRAPSKKSTAKEQRSADASRLGETETVDTVTRISPFRVSTLVSIAPIIQITTDFGVMARQEGNPVPYEHQLYRTTLQGMFSLNLHTCGTFSYRQKAGYRNLDNVRTELAEKQGLEHLVQEKAYRLPLAERVRRVQGLFDALALLEGGAKQAIHYTDVTPALSITAVTRGGNHIFGHVVGANSKGLPEISIEALQEVFATMGDEIVSPVYVGWVQGYLDEERKKFERFIEDCPQTIIMRHPRDTYRVFVADLARPENAYWLA